MRKTMRIVYALKLIGEKRSNQKVQKFVANSHFLVCFGVQQNRMQQRKLFFPVRM